MSQRSVERVIGRLVTDEDFRRRFAEDPAATIEELIASGVELTPVEARALAGMDCEQVARIAQGIDPRLQKIGGCGDRS